MDLSEVWEAHGKTVLERLAVTEPKALAQIAYGVLPRDILIGIEQRLPGGLDPDDWNMLVRIAGVVKELAPNAGGDEIEDALRCALARPIVENNA